jgi:heptosyltransferase-1
VVKPSSLGDVVHTLPAVASVRRAFPEARIRWIINPEWAPLLEGNPDIDGTVIFPRGEFRGVRGVTKLVPWIRKIRREVQADLVLDFRVCSGARCWRGCVAGPAEGSWAF